MVPRFCRCGEKRRIEKAQAASEDGFAQNRALTQLESLPNDCEASKDGFSTDQQLHGKARGHQKKAVKKRETVDAARNRMKYRSIEDSWV